MLTYISLIISVVTAIAMDRAEGMNAMIKVH